MTRRLAAFTALLVGALALASSAGATTVRYRLTEESRVTLICADCEADRVAPQVLRGAFDVSLMPGPSDYAVDAVTGLRWRSDLLTITGSGFVQRLGEDHLAMVIDARFNGVPLLLTSGHRQRSGAGEIRLQLSSPTGAGKGFRVTLVAVPESAAGNDPDGDGLTGKVDNCPGVANPDGADGDADGVGDACDTCPGTLPGSPLLANGCSLAQSCPCDGPRDGEEWDSPRAYMQCVARQLKTLRQQGVLGRSEIKPLLQDAVRSGCGRRLLALN